MPLSVAILLASLLPLSSALAQAPSLVAKGEAVQLHVDGKPFLIRGGELGNSTASDLDALAAHWETFEAVDMNTVLAPVSWELIEPEEGVFDFSSVDGLLEQARAAKMKLVLLWFGSYKNSMSSYAPSWVKRDPDRFPRAEAADGTPQEILSPYAPANWQADAEAFRALMAHLRNTDNRERTVIMVQVENELGMLPDARDHSPEAEAAFAAPPPAGLPGVEGGSWRAAVGETPEGEELFSAWGLARYANAVAEAGLEAYDLPLFVNAALNRPGAEPGAYPSGGPLEHLFGIWEATAPAIDFLAPDIYFESLVERVAPYDYEGNAVFIPEANRAGREEAGADMLWAVGALDAIGFSPFSIEDIAEDHSLGEAYRLVASLEDLILGTQGTDALHGLKPSVSFGGDIDLTPQTVTIGDYEVTATFKDPWTPLEAQTPAAHGVMLIATGPSEFLAAGRGATLTFAREEGQAGIEAADSGRMEDGRFVALRRMNGDQTHQGRHVRLPPDGFTLQRVRLYSYD
ncbi:DUF5597 domain-containing protein [Parvularcula oceani]|uniref:DUF5597 domain-containing protein n=1 Tax=Parvularcula oceani TaxID=1247963 RepID=UPI0004E1BDAD|nr:DUF5597 domain-containing protein [Parvularcula oceani]